MIYTLRSILVPIVCLLAGCAGLQPGWYGGNQPAANHLIVSNPNQEVVWERTVDVLHEYLFTIARESKQAHIIETEYKTGSGLLEPWHADSIGIDNQLESTFQSIRRKVIVYITPAENGAGYIVSVEAFKELEDLEGLAANSQGGATFQEATPLQRDLNLVVGQSRPSGWIPKGRDNALEQSILADLRDAYSN